MSSGDGRSAGSPRDRGRRLLRGAAVGFALGSGGVVLATAAGIPVREANGVVFPLAAMVFGLGLAAWASIALYGTTLERGARRTQVSENFTSERAAAITGTLAVVGLTGMLGGSVASIVISWLVT